MNYYDIRKDFVARNCDVTSGITENNFKDLGRGELRVLDEDGNIIDTAAKAQKAKSIRLVQGVGVGEEYVISDYIQRKDLIKVYGQKFTQKSERKAIVGFNGVEGEIDLLVANDYMIEIKHKGSSHYRNANPYNNLIGYKVGSSPDTQLTIASKLVEVGCLNYSEFSQRVANMYKICSIPAGSEVSLAGTGNLTFEFGTNMITAATNIDAVLTEGDAIRIATGVTNAVYVVDKLDTVNNIAYVDQLILMDTVTIADTVAKALSKGTGANQLEHPDVNYGIVVEGVTPSPKPGFGAYDMVDFELTTRNFDDTLVTKRGTGYDLIVPSGRHEQAGISEFYMQGNHQRGLEIDRQFLESRADIEEDHGYSMYAIEFQTNEKLGTVGRDGQKKQLCIWIDRGTYAQIETNDAATALKTNIVNAASAGDWDVNGVAFTNILNAFAGKAGVIENTANTVNAVKDGGESLAGGTVNGGDTKYNAGIDF